MSKTEENRASSASVESEARSAITTFEQILEVVPDDRLALESLHEAYLGLGDTQNALKYLLRLADLLDQSREWDALAGMLDKLHFLADNHPEIMERIQALETQLQAGESLAPGRQTASSEDEAGQDIRPELALAWKLHESDLLTQEEYASIANDLTEMLSRKVDVPITLLHILYDQGYKQTERIVQFLIKDSRTPHVHISSFETPPSVREMLPLDFMSRRAAIPFEVIGREVMIGILNPYDENLLSAVRQIIKAPCHFYLVTPADYDHALNSLRQAILMRMKDGDGTEAPE
jgi:tetratricopeptide (TPR) repeat protein